jgi:3-hydroxyacyl-[acyl-carrier-protein] dehydratase
MFAGLRGYRVTGQVYPGEVLRHIVELIHSKADTAFATGATWADGRLIARATTMVAVCRPRSVLDRRDPSPKAGQEAVP